MDLDLSADEIAFRDEVRAFFRDNLPEPLKRGQRLNPGFFSEPDIGVPWNRILFEKGWIAPAWPKEHGGTGWSLTQRHIFEIEWNRAGAPYLQMQGLRMVGPVIMRYGTEAQKAFYLPRILSGEDYWCQGYSEPGAGSDLASLSTRAVADGDHYVVNGSKLWTTHAHYANRMFALVRTAETDKPQKGITFLLIDMDTPGIEVRSVITIDGAHDVNEVFLTDVRVPVANRIGEENGGWECAKYLLEFERAGGLASGQLRMALGRAHRLARATGDGARTALDDTAIAGRLADILCETDALEMMELTVMSQLDLGQNPGPVSSMLKVRGSEIRQAISELVTDILGIEAQLWHARRPLHHNRFADAHAEEAAAASAIYLSERAHTIFAGATEIQLSIIARSLLSLAGNP